MSRLKYVRHCLCNALYVYCRGRAVTNVGKTCGPTPCFVLAINTFKLNYQVLFIIGKELISYKVLAFHENPDRMYTEPSKRISQKSYAFVVRWNI